METNKESNTTKINAANFLKENFNLVINKLDKIINNQHYIKASNTEIGRMIQEYYKSCNNNLLNELYK